MLNCEFSDRELNLIWAGFASPGFSAAGGRKGKPLEQDLLGILTPDTGLTYREQLQGIQPMQRHSINTYIVPSSGLLWLHPVCVLAAGQPGLDWPALQAESNSCLSLPSHQCTTAG